MTTTLTPPLTENLHHRQGGILQAYGYIRKHFLMSDSELAAARQNIVDASQVHQFELVAIYVEEIETAPDDFHKLLATVMLSEHKAIIVPGLHHFAVLGDPKGVRSILESNGITVFLARNID